MAEEMNMPLLTVKLLDTITGKTAIQRGFDWSWWTVGNGSCDCNRALPFDCRDESGECLGCKRYLVVDVDGERPGPEFNECYPAELIAKASACYQSMKDKLV